MHRFYSVLLSDSTFLPLKTQGERVGFIKRTSAFVSDTVAGLNLPNLHVHISNMGILVKPSSQGLREDQTRSHLQAVSQEQVFKKIHSKFFLFQLQETAPKRQGRKVSIYVILVKGEYTQSSTFFFCFNLLLAALCLRCCEQAFLQLQRTEATLRCGAWTSHCSGFSCCRVRALGVRASVVVAHGLSSYGSWAQQLWLAGLAAPRYVGSSWTRARTRVPCIGREIPNHCATREVPKHIFFAEGFCQSREGYCESRGADATIKDFSAFLQQI